MPTERGSGGGEGETSTDEPSGKICTWHPDEEETTSPTLTTDNSDVTTTAPTVHPHRGGEEQSVMAASLPAAKVSAVRHGGFSGT